jgi:dTDP-4-amino-4,6-dideoxygalactose transaminase
LKQVLPQKQKLCCQYIYLLVEDCAQAHGTLYNGKQVGTFGDAGCFSFMPAKNLGAYGDAGAVITHSKELAEKIQMLRNHGRKEKYVHEMLGYAERIDNIQALILDIKLTHLDAWNARRQQIAQQYQRSLRKDTIALVATPTYSNSTFYGFHILVDNRSDLIKRLTAAGIETNIYYPLALHLQPVFSYLGYKKSDLPNVQTFTSRVLALPIHPFLTEDEIEYIIEMVNQHA